MKNSQKQFFIFLTVAFFLLPAAVSAATISFVATPQQVGVGDVVRVDVLLESAVPTNAFSGTVSFKNASLAPIAVYDGSSIVSMWITRPAADAAHSSIQFAGITPGGFSGSAGKLFSMLLKATAAGAATISVADVQVLRNDGLGGEEQVAIKPLSLSIKSNALGGYTEADDHTPPESFAAYLGTDSQLFDSQKYLVFTAVDKISGVDHYEVVESRIPQFLFALHKPRWHVAASPFMLSDQRLVSTVYVKAIDRAGNERLSVYPPTHLFTPYESVALLGILIAVVFFWQKRTQRRSRKNP